MLKNPEKFDVIFIGNPIIDILLQESENFLKDHNLPQKGSSILIDQKRANILETLFKNGEIYAGGSAANTAYHMAKNNLKIGHIGRVAHDEMGKLFARIMQENNINFIYEEKILPATYAGTGVSFILITPDKERTMSTYLGVAGTIDLGLINQNLNMLENTKYLYIEGYIWWNNEIARKAIIEAANIAMRNGAKIILTLSDSQMVSENRDSLYEFINNHINILFGNEEEFKSLFNEKREPFKFKEKILKICDLNIITKSEKGAEIIGSNLYINSRAKIVRNIIDLTGAGDAFAGGFLTGMLRGKTYEECLNMGNKLAAKIITKIGGR